MKRITVLISLFFAITSHAFTMQDYAKMARNLVRHDLNICIENETAAMCVCYFLSNWYCDTSEYDRCRNVYATLLMRICEDRNDGNCSAVYGQTERICEQEVQRKLLRIMLNDRNNKDF